MVLYFTTIVIILDTSIIFINDRGLIQDKVFDHYLAKGIVYPHHHPRFAIDEDALAIGVEVFSIR
ncbi:hypothetical protein [Neobacillus massiliamazoniensis]|uniref:hypothetical protein n=1 Tax=Neobacillus massiliamazoniensis TaxID=1499688 RepID=UPI000B2D8D05|nr:hypothetical protein [Neobacillus massiliamazoniensis]